MVLGMVGQHSLPPGAAGHGGPVRDRGGHRPADPGPPVAQRFPFWDHVLNLWSWTRYVLLFSIFFLFILAVLNMAAPFGTPRLPVLLSSLVSALALVVSSAVFSWFISMSSRYSLVYGSLVSLIILLIWLYLCGQILFIGIVFTSVWYKHWRRRRLTDPDD